MPKQITETRLRELERAAKHRSADFVIMHGSEPMTADELRYALACCRAVEAVRDVIAQASVYPDGEPCEGASYGEALIDMKLLLVKHLGEKP